MIERNRSFQDFLAYFETGFAKYNEISRYERKENDTHVYWGFCGRFLWGVFWRPTAHNASPSAPENPPQKSATERPSIDLCKVETSYCFVT